VQTSTTFAVTGASAKVLNTRYFAGFGGSGQAVAGRTYDVSADGKRFLMVKENATGEPAATSLVVVLNLGEELRKRAPAGGSR
jgi:hypothetical protein